MADHAPVDTSGWSPIRWSELPVVYREHPDNWPEPHRPSTRQVRWWRTGAIAAALVIVGFAVYCGASPPGEDGRSALESVALAYSALFSLVLAPLTWFVASWPYFKISDRVHDVLQKTRGAQREMTRALRQGVAIPKDRQPLLRLRIVQVRTELRRLQWLSYLYAAQLTLRDGETWSTSIWLVLVTVWVFLLVFVAARAMAFRCWESGAARSTS